VLLHPLERRLRMLHLQAEGNSEEEIVDMRLCVEVAEICTIANNSR